MKQIKKFGVYENNNRRVLYTKNLTPGKSLFEEPLEKHGAYEYREWDVSHSKLAAGIRKGLSQIGIKEGDIVLYLGASHGYTPSFVSDIVGKHGFVFCVDHAPRVMRDLIFICEERMNMAPIMADANKPETYKDLILPEVDIVFQDIAQRDQVGIFLKNCEAYLKKAGVGLLAIKARSIDVSKNPKEIFMKVRSQLEKKITIVDYRELAPYEKDHALFVCKKK